MRLAGLCLSLTFVFPALGGVVQRQTIEEMTRSATVVVRGRVRQQQASWDADHRRIDTYTEVQVTEGYKGTALSTVLVRQPGGVVGRIGQSASGAAAFTPGEEVILFLEPARDDPALFLPLALAAGKVQIDAKALGGPRAVRRLSGLAFYDPGVRAPDALRPLDVEDLGPLEAFVQRVRAAARGGNAR